ncbi:hypothetical protein QBC46DRAFT_307969 [Diplogelasinospora grovesii]|uniref:Uncharacterized protein n=1 Tax=Diplogelasinospora grovesii TaxID=303347 RepID=A0AAN6NDH3_9PEZI|nr:hypothetical protein QBC46DRAFT_307969 [Diplogelasinospora grovesii]
MTEQNGIDILCDAASSDLLFGAGFTLQPRSESNSAAAAEVAEAAEAAGEAPSQKRLKRFADDRSSPSSASHVCHICKRVYERADHLTRHMRSHENARQYQCTRCPKRFNRADLLTRHETTHDRDSDGKGRVMMRRSDRAAEACVNCASSKAKCDDQKPCGRCRSKNLMCQTPPRRTQTFKTASEADSVLSPSDSSTMASNMVGTSYSMPNAYDLAHKTNMLGNTRPSANASEPLSGLNDILHGDSTMDGIADDMVFFNPVHNLFQDMDFTSWDLNFDAFPIPQLDSHGPSPQSTGTNNTSKSAGRPPKDPARRHAVFKRSPWLWEPETTDYVRKETEGLHLNEEGLSRSSAFGRLLDRPINKLKMSIATRDQLFAIVLAESKDPTSVRSFPSLELLNYLLQAHFVHDEYQFDSWIHSATFNPEEVIAELLASIIANGASFIAVPSIWQFGFAMQEIVRQRLETIFEASNENTRKLECHQSYMLQLDIGIWSGFKRKTELAESFLQPLLTMLRRGGFLTAPADSPSLVPFHSDSPEVVEAKWHKFIRRESYKRLVIHLFSHDVQSSVSLQKNPLMSFTELSFSLPAARDLWKAPSAEAWRDAYLAKSSLPADRPLPRVSEVMHSLDVLDQLGEYVDLELCYAAVLHGFWGQIAAYREAVKFYNDGGLTKRNTTHQLWLKSQHQELYKDLNEFSSIIYTSLKSPAHMAIAELFMMVLHISLDDLQKFAGKAGEEEARRASVALEEGWVQSSEARYAVWHAGQVLHSARKLPPTSLKGFKAMAVYFASLTLWVYGYLSCSAPSNDALLDEGGGMGDGRRHRDSTRRPTAQPPGPSFFTQKFVVMDGDETRETRAFLQLNRGVPGLTHNGDPKGGVEPLSNPSMILVIARDLFRDNFPVRDEPLPPLVESLGNLLRDLDSRPAGRSSRATSDHPADAV